MMKKIFLSTLFASALALSTATASAQSDANRSTARATAKAGQKAFVDGDYEKSLKLFRKAESLMHAPTHLLFIARSYEKVGQLVNAQEAYQKLIYEKLDSDAPGAFARAQETARAELSALEPRIPQMTIALSGASLDDFVLIIDGKERPGVEGVPQPIDPGPHQFEVKADGFAAQPVDASFKEGEQKTVTLTLSEAASEAAAAPAEESSDAPAQEPAAPAQATSETPPPSSGSSGMKTAGWIGIGAGVVGIGTGAALAIVANGKKNKVNELCEKGCADSDKDEIIKLDSDYATFGTLSVVGFAAGAVALGTGITLLALDKPSDEHAFEMKGVAFTPALTPGGVSVSGSF